MKHLQHERRWYAIVVGAIVLMAAVFVIGVIRNNQSSDPVPTPPVTTPTEESAKDTPAEEDFAQEVIDEKATEPPTIDASELATIVIEPLNLTVSYVRGIGGFAYVIQRTQSGTEYVEFSAESLVGTKCTDDTGVFASIIVNPAANDVATLANTTTIGEDTYGLALPDNTCTGNPDLFADYQASFRDAFGLLKKS